MIEQDNPAKRLYNILALARNEGDELPTREVWAKVLKASALPEPHFLQQLVYLQELVYEVKKAFQQIKQTKLVNQYMTHYADIELATSISNVDAPWSNYKHFLNDQAMFNLKHIGEKLSMSDYKLCYIISDDILYDLEREVLNLAEKVRQGVLDSSLKVIIIDQLEAIHRSINEYRLRGIEGMKKVLAYTYGEFIINHKLFEKEKNKDEVIGFGKIIFKYANIINSVYRIGEIGYEAGKFFAKYLGYDVSNE